MASESTTRTSAQERNVYWCDALTSFGVEEDDEGAVTDTLRVLFICGAEDRPCLELEGEGCWGVVWAAGVPQRRQF